MSAYHRYRFFVFTENNPEGEYDWDTLKDKIRYLSYQEEVGDNGTFHFQGYLELHSPTTPGTVARLLGGRAHVEPAICPDKADEYSKKEESRVGNQYCHGSRVSKGVRTDIHGVRELIKAGKTFEEIRDIAPREAYRYHQMIKEEVLDQQTDRKEYPHAEVLIGRSGSGKTSRGIRFAEKNGYTYHVQSAANWKDWAGYKNQDVVVIDEVEPGTIPYWFLKRLLDRTPEVVNIKYGNRKFNSPYIFITSNHRLAQWWGPVNLTPLYRRCARLWIHDPTSGWVDTLPSVYTPTDVLTSEFPDASDPPAKKQKI